MFDVDNVVLLMFTRLIKYVNEGFFNKRTKLSMYKICIKSYMSIKHYLTPKLRLKKINIIIWVTLKKY